MSEEATNHEHSAYIRSRNIRVFVSSTFRDMQEERDILMNERAMVTFAVFIVNAPRTSRFLPEKDREAPPGGYRCNRLLRTQRSIPLLLASPLP